MADKDGVLKILFEDNVNFVDVANLVLFDGRPQLRPENLREANPEEIGWLAGMNCENERLLKSYRDVCRSFCRKTDGQKDYLIVGIENQSELDYGMVGRVLVENVMNYARQMRDFQRNHKKPVADGEKQQVTAEDFLSSMHCSDRLRPVVTIVIYWGTKPWTGPVSFRDLLEKCEPEIMALQPDFQMPLLIPERIPEEKLNCLSKNMRLVLKYAGASKDKNLLRRRLASDADFCSVPPIVMEVFKKVIGVKFKDKPNEQGDVNMCYAQEQLEQDAREEGLKLGEERGLKLGEERGLKLGEERGLKLGEERGLKLGEERGLMLGKKEGLQKAIEALIRYEMRQGTSQEELCRMIMGAFMLEQEEASQCIARMNYLNP